MKKLITVLLAITLLGCASVYPPPVEAQQTTPQQVQQAPAVTGQVELQQMELRALVAEIDNLKRQNNDLVNTINEKVERARLLQGQLQAEQLRQEKAAKGKAGGK